MHKPGPRAGLRACVTGKYVRRVPQHRRWCARSARLGLMRARRRAHGRGRHIHLSVLCFLMREIADDGFDHQKSGESRKYPSQPFDCLLGAVKLARKYDQKFAEHCELIGGDFISGLTAATARSIAASGLNVTVREQTIRSECSQH